MMAFGLGCILNSDRHCTVSGFESKTKTIIFELS